MSIQSVKRALSIRNLAVNNSFRCNRTRFRIDFTRVRAMALYASCLKASKISHCSSPLWSIIRAMYNIVIRVTLAYLLTKRTNTTSRSNRSRVTSLWRIAKDLISGLRSRRPIVRNIIRRINCFKENHQNSQRILS